MGVPLLWHHPRCDQRVPELEAYLPLSQFLGFMVPADTDAAVLAYLEDVFHQAMQTDKIKQFAEEQICQIYDLTGDEASEFAAQLESKLCWVLYDMGQTTYSPEPLAFLSPACNCNGLLGGAPSGALPQRKGDTL